MQAASSRKCSLLSRLALFAALACSAPAPAVSVPVTAAPPPAKTAPWPRFAEVSAWAPVGEAPFPSQGHDTALPFARVRTNPEARDAYVALVQDSVLAEGSLVALFHESADGTTRGAVYVMQKAGGRWQYLLLDALGHPRIQANLARCAGCHADAMADHLFGLPRARSAPTAARLAE